MYIGEGPILYLQIQKTFAILFFVLSVLNIPIYWIYAASNEVSPVNSVFSYDWKSLTIGTLGFKEEQCMTSHVSYDLA